MSPYYTVSQQPDGWHAYQLAEHGKHDEQVFPTRRAALAWITSVGGLPQPDEVEAGVKAAEQTEQDAHAQH